MPLSLTGMTTPNAATTTSLGSAAATATTEAQAAVGAADSTNAQSSSKVDSAATAGASSTPEQKAAADKVAADAKAADELSAKPFTDAAQLKLADGFTLDAAFLPFAKEHGFTAKQAQGAVDLYAKLSQSSEAVRAAALEAKHEAASKAAIESLKSDKEIGGANWDKSMGLAGKALARFGSPEVIKTLNETVLADGSMLGDNVHVARLLVNIGKGLAEDSVSGTHSNGATKTSANDKATFHRALYPKSPGLT